MPDRNLLRRLLRTLNLMEEKPQGRVLLPICSYCRQPDCETGVSGCGRMAYDGSWVEKSDA